MDRRKKYRSLPLGIAAPSSLLVKKVNESRAAKASTARAKERAVDAPPESSDDDDHNAEDISDVSDDEPRGAIQPSSFGSSGKTTNRPATASRQPGLLIGQSRPNNGQDSAVDRGTKRARDAGTKTDAKTYTKTVDLSEKKIEFEGRAKPRQGYGAARKAGSQSASSQPQFKPPPAALTEDTPPRKASKRVDAKVPKFKLSKYDDSEDEAATATASTIPPPEPKPAFKVSKYSMSSDEEREEAKAKDSKNKEKTSAPKSNPGKPGKPSKPSKSFKNNSSGIFGRRRAEAEEAEKKKDEKDEKKEDIPKAVFRMPEYDAMELGPDVDVAAFDEESLSQTMAKADDTPPQLVCPLCKTAVDADTVRELLPGHYLLKRPGVAKLQQLKFDEKVMFCAGHKQRTSRHAWTARGYPAIDWDALPARLEAHFGHVRDVLRHKRSTYRTAYEGSRKAMDDVALVPGYYGRRGQQVLSAAIIQRLSDVLRQQAVEDPVVAARGMAQYVQAVLVPELAVQLIREDMGGLVKITAVEGRQILEESAAIGEEVMEEERDVVAEESEDGGGGSSSEGRDQDGSEDDSDATV